MDPQARLHASTSHPLPRFAPPSAPVAHAHARRRGKVVGVKVEHHVAVFYALLVSVQQEEHCGPLIVPLQGTQKRTKCCWALLL
jgi:hypothetical protein